MKTSLFTLAACLLATSAAHAGVVVVGHPSAAPLTKEQVSDAFLGKVQSAVLVDQPEAAPIRAEFYKSATGKEPPQVKAVWARLIFTGKAQPPKELADASAVKKAVAADPKALGYIDKGAVDDSVKVLLTLE